jgi:hypothetical protein
MNTKKHIDEMAFEPGRFPDWVDKGKKSWIEGGAEELKELLPDLTEKEQSYVEVITSETYQRTLERLEQYTGQSAGDLNVPSLYGLFVKTLEAVKKVEGGYKHELEELAIDTVLQLPEFEMIKELYDSGELGIDASLESGDLSKALEAEEASDEGGLSQEEEINLDIANAFEDVDEKKLQRKFANMLIQGGSASKLYLFNLVNPTLEEISPYLSRAYGVLAGMAELGYWITPEGIEKQAASEAPAGSEEIDTKDDDMHIIKAKGMTFPYLVHEIAKGIYEYISVDPDVELVRGEVDTIEGETRDLLVGPGIYKTLTSYIPNDKMKYLPLVQKKVIKLKPDKIKQILAKSKTGWTIMKEILIQAEEEWDEYKKPEEEEIDYDFDFDEEIDLGLDDDEPWSFEKEKRREKEENDNDNDGLAWK